RYYRILSEDMLVVHDDIDLAFGRIKIKEKGGDGGHKGVRSIIDAFGGGDFVRLRMGVGRPEAGISAADYVLGKFTIKEKKVLHRIITEARDAVGTILCKGTKEGMNRFNDKRIVISS
ncbi:MAG: aminoacyl-tRNA hydrolase, partial [Deltaproteobacteria bacterium]|nr:aminoacyl-tRNA hydrolase [Deltaproteobacteria bacterium]